MNAILGMTDLLWETELDEDQRHYVEIFRRAGANLMELINDILDLSKIESGRLALEKTEFDVQTVVADVIELLAPKARDKGSDCALTRPGHHHARAGRRRPPAPGAGKSDGQRHQIHQLGRSGGLSGTHPGQAGRGTDFRCIRYAASVFPRTSWRPIFEAFEQVDALHGPQIRRHRPGIADFPKAGGMHGRRSARGKRGRPRQYVPLHGRVRTRGRSLNGELNAPSVAPKPAPKGADAVSAGEAATPRPRACPSPIRILVAEDSLDNQFLLQAYLKSSPYTAVFVADGRAAVKQFREGEFAAILMDMQMPVMDGLTATRTIREMEKRQGRLAIPDSGPYRQCAAGGDSGLPGGGMHFTSFQACLESRAAEVAGRTAGSTAIVHSRP